MSKPNFFSALTSTDAKSKQLSISKREVDDALWGGKKLKKVVVNAPEEEDITKSFVDAWTQLIEYRNIVKHWIPLKDINEMKRMHEKLVADFSKEEKREKPHLPAPSIRRRRRAGSDMSAADTAPEKSEYEKLLISLGECFGNDREKLISEHKSKVETQVETHIASTLDSDCTVLTSTADIPSRNSGPETTLSGANSVVDCDVEDTDMFLTAVGDDNEFDISGSRSRTVSSAAPLHRRGSNVKYKESGLLSNQSGGLLSNQSSDASLNYGETLQDVHPKRNRLPSSGGGLAPQISNANASTDSPVLSKKNQQTKHLLLNSEEYVASLWCALLKKPDKGKIKLAQRMREAAAAQKLLDEAAAKEAAELAEAERLAQEEKERFEANLREAAEREALRIAEEAALKEKAFSEAKAAKAAAKAAAAAARMEAAQKKKKSRGKSGKVRKKTKNMKSESITATSRGSESATAGEDTFNNMQDEESSFGGDTSEHMNGSPSSDDEDDMNPNEIKWFPFSEVPLSREMVHSSIRPRSSVCTVNNIVGIVNLLIADWLERFPAFNAAYENWKRMAELAASGHCNSTSEEQCCDSNSAVFNIAPIRELILQYLVGFDAEATDAAEWFGEIVRIMTSGSAKTGTPFHSIPDESLSIISHEEDELPKPAMSESVSRPCTKEASSPVKYRTLRSRERNVKKVLLLQKKDLHFINDTMVSNIDQENLIRLTPCPPSHSAISSDNKFITRGGNFGGTAILSSPLRTSPVALLNETSVQMYNTKSAFAQVLGELDVDEPLDPLCAVEVNQAQNSFGSPNPLMVEIMNNRLVENAMVRETHIDVLSAFSTRACYGTTGTEYNGNDLYGKEHSDVIRQLRESFLAQSAHPSEMREKYKPRTTDGRNISSDKRTGTAGAIVNERSMNSRGVGSGAPKTPKKDANLGAWELSGTVFPELVTSFGAHSGGGAMTCNARVEDTGNALGYEEQRDDPTVRARCASIHIQSPNPLGPSSSQTSFMSNLKGDSIQSEHPSDSRAEGDSTCFDFFASADQKSASISREQEDDDDVSCLSVSTAGIADKDKCPKDSSSEEFKYSNLFVCDKNSIASEDTTYQLLRTMERYSPVDISDNVNKKFPEHLLRPYESQSISRRNRFARSKHENALCKRIFVPYPIKKKGMDFKDVSIEVDPKTGKLYLIAMYAGTVNKFPSLSGNVSSQSRCDNFEGYDKNEPMKLLDTSTSTPFITQSKSSLPYGSESSGCTTHYVRVPFSEVQVNHLGMGPASKMDRSDGVASIIASSSIPFHYNTAHLHFREGSSVVDEMVVLKAPCVPGEYITSMKISEWQQLLQITENEMLIASAAETALKKVAMKRKYDGKEPVVGCQVGDPLKFKSVHLNGTVEVMDTLTDSSTLNAEMVVKNKKAGVHVADPIIIPRPPNQWGSRSGPRITPRHLKGSHTRSHTGKKPCLMADTGTDEEFDDDWLGLDTDGVSNTK